MSSVFGIDNYFVPLDPEDVYLALYTILSLIIAIIVTKSCSVEDAVVEL